jgi:hypothetical protein
LLREFPASLRITPPFRAPRRATACLGIVALLFQAILSAWHHHTQPLPLHDVSAIRAVAVANGDPVPLSADDCEICFALGHHAAAPVDFFAPPLADQEPVPLLSAAAVQRPLPSYLLFRSRAPPRA